MPAPDETWNIRESSTKFHERLKEHGLDTLSPTTLHGKGNPHPQEDPTLRTLKINTLLFKAHKTFLETAAPPEKISHAKIFLLGQTHDCDADCESTLEHIYANPTKLIILERNGNIHPKRELQYFVATLNGKENVIFENQLLTGNSEKFSYLSTKERSQAIGMFVAHAILENLQNGINITIVFGENHLSDIQKATMAFLDLASRHFYNEAAFWPQANISFETQLSKKQNFSASELLLAEKQLQQYEQNNSYAKTLKQTKFATFIKDFSKQEKADIKNLLIDTITSCKITLEQLCTTFAKINQEKNLSFNDIQFAINGAGEACCNPQKENYQQKISNNKYKAGEKFLSTTLIDADDTLLSNEKTNTTIKSVGMFQHKKPPEPSYGGAPSPNSPTNITN
jgi:hypothetical protein